jgi:hypothetical protein
MLFSPSLLNVFLGPNAGGNGLSTKTGNNQFILKLLNDYLPTHMLFVQDDVQIDHYSSIVKQSVIKSLGNENDVGQFGQVNVHSGESTVPGMHLFSNQNTDNNMSLQLHQLLRVIFTLVSLAESNTEHFIGTCLSKHMKAQTLSFGESLLQFDPKNNQNNNNNNNNPKNKNINSQHFDHILQLNETYFSMSHVINQTGRGVKCDIAVPLSYLPPLGNQNDNNYQSNSNGITLANVIIGNANWLIENNIYIPPIIAAIAIQLESQGLTVIFSSIQGQIVGLFSIGDEIKPEAFEVIDYLQSVIRYQIFSCKIKYPISTCLCTFIPITKIKYYSTITNPWPCYISY